MKRLKVKVNNLKKTDRNVTRCNERNERKKKKNYKCRLFEKQKALPVSEFMQST